MPPRRMMGWAAKNTRFAWLSLLPFAVVLACWAVDREPPFAITGPVVATDAKPGGTATFVMPVRRDLDRECSVQFYRFLIDGNRYRHDQAAMIMSASAVRAMDERMTPGWLRMTVHIPENAAPGSAMVVTNLSYQCNPLQRWWPIQVTTYLHFRINPVDHETDSGGQP